MGDSIKQKKYYNREQFTYDEKQRILAKSDNVCCHCGKKIFVGYGATVDHFIPLNKGGSNQFLNLIPLCKDCNDEKDDKLYNMDYIVHIKDKYREELSKYLESYVQVIDYVQRHRLLAYDEYKQEVFIRPKNIMRGSKIHKNKKVGVKCSYTLKYATWNDLDKMTNYLIRYLNKNNALDSEEAARENIVFWMQFGCIYYIEKNNEVTNMFALTIKHMDQDEDFRGIDNQPYMYIFPYYQSDISEQITVDMIYEIPKIICNENNLKIIPLNIVLLGIEKMQYLLSYLYKAQPTSDVVDGFIVFHILVGDDVLDDYKNIHKEYDEMTEVEKETCDFFKKFNDVTNKMISYFEKYQDRSSISWMINSILSTESIKSSGLDKYFNINEGEDE